jgi:hypothetical protein
MRRGRRLNASPRGGFFESESRPVGMMGSGNFEVIRGGFFPSNGQGVEGAASNNNAGGGEMDEDSANVFSALEDDFFGAGSPGILGFQGFNHFSGASIYNTLAPSNQKKVEVKPDAESPVADVVFPAASSTTSSSSAAL